MKAKKSPDKRKYERIPLQSIVFYRVEKNKKDKDIENLMTSQTPLSVDLSEGGMKILAMQALPEGVNLKIVLTFYEHNIPIDLEGLVAWCRKAETGTDYEVGIKFVGISEIKRKIIKKHLLSQKKSSIL